MIKAWALTIHNIGASVIAYIILVVRYSFCSVLYPKALFPLFRPLHYGRCESLTLSQHGKVNTLRAGADVDRDIIVVTRIFQPADLPISRNPKP